MCKKCGFTAALAAWEIYGCARIVLVQPSDGNKPSEDVSLLWQYSRDGYLGNYTAV